MRLISLSFIICHLSFSRVAAQQLRVEYFWDADPGSGKGTWVTATPDADGNLDFEASATGLEPGIHLLGFRAFQAGTNDEPWHYGPTITRQIYVPADESWTNVSRVEYFWDVDPGCGKGSALTVTPGTELNLNNIEISTEGLSTGSHLLGIRAFGGWGWSPTLTQQVYVTPNTPTSTQITFAEYFWDTDPGCGKGTPIITFTCGEEVNIENLEIPTDGLSMGNHELFIRAFGYAGWTPTIQSTVCVLPDEDDIVVNRAEYFWDVDPGFGEGTSINITQGQEVNIAGIGLSVDGLSIGEHQLFIRYRGPLGWSPTVVTDVINISEADLKVASAEYFWNEDPGFGHGTAIDLTPDETVSLNDFNIPSSAVHGDATLFIRYRGPLGWSPTVAYPVMVDAEGNYTLNATQESSIETRNYQSLTDALYDFTDRGIGSSITLNVSTTNTDYALDATSEQVLAQLAQAAENLEDISDTREHKTIAFTAAENSGNTLTVTTTADGLPTVVSFFAQTKLTNVALTINGTAYDFTPATLRSEEVCAGTATTPVDLTTVSSAITATWTAQPHEGTVLTGFEAQASGSLPAMTISHNGTELDSIAYAVTLTNGQTQLYAYTYYIYVHPRMADQQLSGLTPVTGSSLDPGEVVMTWNKVDDAIGGYRLTVSSVPSGDTNAEPEVTNIDTDETSYTITALTGRTYSWTVTAIGFCDEKTSTPMTFSGRLLPDLVVSSITPPEAAEAGNTITVTATISNQGPGTTTEGSWKDRLYYAINTTDFAQAVQAAEVLHEGNIAAAGTYDVTFTMQVPDVDNGTMRFFVITDAVEAVMEADDSNNRTQAAQTATLSPFYMNSADLTALRKLYTDFGGSNWNGTPWNTASELIAAGNWSGVTFDTNGRVTAINLQGRGLTGTLSSETAPTLPQLTTLNLSRNALKGDPATFITTAGLPLLTSLNLAYNQIDELSAALPLTVSVDLTYQHRQYGNENVSVGFDDMTPTTLDIGDNAQPTLPTLFSYNHQSQTFSNPQTLEVKHPSNNTYYGTLTWDGSKGAYVFNGYGNEINLPDGFALRLMTNYTSATSNGSAFPATASVITGDATLDGTVDVNDVERTLLRIIDPNKYGIGTINLWAANTYTADETDMVINIQDIVCSVNLVLESQQSSNPGARALARNFADDGVADAKNVFYIDGQRLMYDGADEIAAFDLVIEGAAPSQVHLLLDDNDWQMATRKTNTGTRLLVFSMNGATLTAGTTSLLHIDGKAVPVSVQASSPLAKTVDVTLMDTETTGISETNRTTLQVSADREGVLLNATTACGPTTVSIRDAQGRLMTSRHYESLPVGTTRLPMAISPSNGIIIVTVNCEAMGTRNYKLQITK